MIATQDDVQQDLMQRTQRWLDILETRTLALLAATNPEDLKPAERETAIHRSLQLTARFLQLRQKTSKASNPQPNYDAWLDQTLNDPQPSDSPPFNPENQTLFEEENIDDEEVNDSPLETLELQTETSDQTYTDPEGHATLPGNKELEAKASRSEARSSYSQQGEGAANAGDPDALLNQVGDRWPFAIIRPQPESPPWLPECLI